MHCHILPQKKLGDVQCATEQVTALGQEYFKETEELRCQVHHLRQQIIDMDVKYYMPPLYSVVLNAHTT